MNSAVSELKNAKVVDTSLKMEVLQNLKTKAYVLILTQISVFESEVYAKAMYEQQKADEYVSVGESAYTVDWLDCRGSKSKTMITSRQVTYPTSEEAIAVGEESIREYCEKYEGLD